MIKKNLKKIIITSIIILLPILVGAIIWDKLPEQVATHFGINGEADGYSSRLFAVIGMPLIMLALHIVCLVATSLDPKSKNIGGKALNLVIWITPTISVVACSVIYAAALGYSGNVGRIMCTFVGFLLIVIGNYLPKCRQNYTIGIKIPWTLNDEENWNKTHRFAGVLWVICGVLTLVSALIGILWFFFVLLGVMLFAPIIYSFLIYRKKKQP